jgi:hypothetical protein
VEVGDDYTDSRDPRNRPWTVVIAAARFGGVAVVCIADNTDRRLWVPLAVFREYYVPVATV